MASMKLRVRAATGGPTIRVQIPLLCTLQGLKDVLGPLVSLPTFSFSLSLNKKDEIQGPGSALLSSFGVTSGDLLFYIVNPGGSSPPILTGSPSSQVVGRANSAESSRVARTSVHSMDGLESIPSQHTGTPNHGGRVVSTPAMRRELCATAATHRQATYFARGQQPETTILSLDSTSPNQKTMVDSNNTTFPGGVVVVPSSNQSMAEQGPFMDMENNSGEPLPPNGGDGHRLVPIPVLLQRVLTAEFENIRQPSMFLILAVHAVMLETGFVKIEAGRSNNYNAAQQGACALDGYELPSGWCGTGFVNLTYTLPELAKQETALGLNQEAFLRCLMVGNTVVVYGAVTDGSPHRVCLSVSKFLHKNLKLGNLVGVGAQNNSNRSSSSVVNKLDDGSGNESVMEPIFGQANTDNFGDGTQMVAAASMGENIFSDIFELWKEVKDSLSLPLLSFMCERTGLLPPPSLLRLPTELKIKVLDLLPPVALANLASACSEFRFLTSSEELWKQKYKEQFGTCGERAPGGRGWKSAFVREFQYRKRSEEGWREAERQFLAEVFTPGVMLRPPSFSHPFGDFFQGLGAEPTQYNILSGPRIQRLPSGNHFGAFLGMGEGGSIGDQDEAYFPQIRLDSNLDRAWPPATNLFLRPSFGNLHGEDIGNRGTHVYVDEQGGFPRLGPFY